MNDKDRATEPQKPQIPAPPTEIGMGAGKREKTISDVDPRRHEKFPGRDQAPGREERLPGKDERLLK